MVNLSPLKVTGGPRKKVITDSIHGAWDQDRSLVVVTAVGVPVEEALSDIGMNSRRAVINLAYNCYEDCINTIEGGS